ncbi:MAG TPA: heavy-metal-associated domain-containing protein [Mycobacteriales bacterium]|nr:heavy-metal-associated domain-containing protein [Mycobacteriales bacterium]
MPSVTLSAPEIHCDHCKRSIEEAVAPLDGVARVMVDVPARTVAVEYAEPANVALVSAAITEAGYDVAGIVAES